LAPAGPPPRGPLPPPAPGTPVSMAPDGDAPRTQAE
jgi:hypothetical protein